MKLGGFSFICSFQYFGQSNRGAGLGGSGAGTKAGKGQSILFQGDALLHYMVFHRKRG